MADMPAAVNVTWKVTNQTEAVQPSPTGPLSKGFNVYFTTSNGLNGSVFVPESQYTEDMVRKMIADKVAQMTRVQSLGGSV